MTIAIDNGVNGSAIGPAKGEPDEAAKLARMKRACVQFEAIFVNYMLKIMRESGKSNDGDDVISMGFNNPFQEVFDWNLSQKLSEKSPLGVADAMMRRYSSLFNEEGKGQVKASLEAAPRIAARRSPPKPPVNPDVEDIIQRAARRFQLDPSLIRAVVRVESAGDTTAVSRAGAKGLMQLMDSTAAEVGVSDPFDPEQNVFGGTAYLKKLMERFRGDERLALAAYNAGPGAVDRWGGVPPYPETTNYVRRVLENYRSTRAPSAAQTNHQGTELE